MTEYVTIEGLDWNLQRVLESGPQCDGCGGWRKATAAEIESGNTDTEADGEFFVVTGYTLGINNVKCDNCGKRYQIKQEEA